MAKAVSPNLLSRSVLFFLATAIAAIFAIEVWIVELGSTNRSLARMKTNLINTFVGYRGATDSEKLPYLVFALDRDFVAKREDGRSWPPSYSTQGAVVRQIVQRLNPRVLFLDLYYRRHRVSEDVAPFLAALCSAAGDDCKQTPGATLQCSPGTILNESSVRIVIGSARSERFSADSALPGMDALVASCPHLSYASLAYNWRIEDSGSYLIRNDRGLTTPAIQIHDVICEVSGGSADVCRETRRRLRRLSQTDGGISVIWGSPRRVDAFPNDAMACLPDPSPEFGAEAIGVDCPFAPKVRATEFAWRIGFDQTGGFGPVGDRLSRFDRPAVLLGNAIGDDIDTIQGAIIDAMPLTGVHLHAMALDNLLTYGSQFKATRMPIGDVCMMTFSFILTFAAGVALLAFDQRLNNLSATGFTSAPLRMIVRFAKAGGQILKLGLLAVIWTSIGAFMFYILDLGVQIWMEFSFRGIAYALIAEGMAFYWALQSSQD